MEINEPAPDETSLATEPQSTPVPPTPPTHMQPVQVNKSPLPWMILVVVLVTIAGYFAFQNYQLQQQLATQQTSLTPPPSAQLADSSPPSTVSPTTDWKIYTSNIHNISFKYPTSWSLVEQEGQREGGQVFNTKLELSRNKAVITMYFNMDGIGGQGQTYKGEEFVLDGINLYQYTKNNSYNNTQTIGISNSLSNTLGVFMIDDVTYGIMLNYPDSYTTEQRSSVKEEFDQILSTFEFTD
ncbi:hypothetical protein KKB83_03755 [Patescibacteria group bacterium]|nr:hypothetical protein [Patescibacteria group bacterium]